MSYFLICRVLCGQGIRLNISIYQDSVNEGHKNERNERTSRLLLSEAQNNRRHL